MRKGLPVFVDPPRITQNPAHGNKQDFDDGVDKPIPALYVPRRIDTAMPLKEQLAMMKRGEGMLVQKDRAPIAINHAAEIDLKTSPQLAIK